MITKELSSVALPKGFRYISNFVTENEKNQILKIVMKNSWCSRLRRQQQYYGIKYFQTRYFDKILQSEQSIDHYPLSELDFIIKKVKTQLNIKSFAQNSSSPNQVLVNKYLQRDALGFHVEDIQAFGQCIVGLSLGDYDYLKLAPADQVGHNKLGEIKIKMEDRSVYILEGQARYRWKHGIGRIYDGIGFKQPNFMRVSLTFRDVIDTRRKL